MTISIPLDHHSGSTIDELLEQLDTYIVALARQKVPRNVIHPELLQDEIDELAQRVRFKLWLVLKKKQILHIKAYISCIIYTEVVDMVRNHLPTLPLPLDEDGELYQGNLMITASEGLQDPALEIEQAEVIDEYVKDMVEFILVLPPCQQRAMICSLKDQLDTMPSVTELLRNHAMDTGEVDWPEKKDELQSLRTSLSLARKKLRLRVDRYR